MMAGNPNSWWSINNNTNSMQNLRTPSRHEQQPTPHDPSPTLLSEQQQQTTTSLFPSHEHHQYVHGSDHDSLHHQYHNHVGCHEQVPISWNPVFLGGFVNEEERYGQPTAAGHQNNQSRKLLEENCSWETQQYLNNISPRISTTAATLPRQDHHHIKEEVMTQQSSSNLLYNNHHQHHEDQDVREDQGGAATYRQLLTANWPHTILPASPKSCVTSLSSGTTNTAVNNNNNILDFSNNKRLHRDDDQKNNQHADHSYECNSTAATTGGVAAAKKTRVQPSSTPPLKVRKEKLGDRITALHQLVSPFGKTDTASVLLEAIGYIRFLQGQIEALSSPYLGSSPAKTQQQSAHGERNCLFPNHPGQLLNDSRLKRRGGAANQDYKDKEGAKDLKSRGLCLVPISCSHLVGNDNGADYWAPSFGGGF